MSLHVCILQEVKNLVGNESYFVKIYYYLNNCFNAQKSLL